MPDRPHEPQAGDMSGKPLDTTTSPRVNKELVMLLVAAFGALSGFYLLVSVVPLYAAGSGGGGFGAAAVVALLPLAVVSALPSKSGDVKPSGSVLRALRAGGLARPTVVFTAITIGAGVFATFLPLAVSAEARGTAAFALLVQSLT